MDWYRMLARQNFSMDGTDLLCGATPPSMFVGSYGYPKVCVGPMLPPLHGDTTMFDNPEGWRLLPLDEIVRMRLGMIRGVRQMGIGDLSGRYIEDLQEVAMSAKPSESEVTFDGPLKGDYNATALRLVRGMGSSAKVDDNPSAPFGPTGVVESVQFSSIPSPQKQIEKAYYDCDMAASDAMVSLYASGVRMSDIQRCLSMGMLGMRRKLVPTKWSITAADSAISDMLLEDVLENGLIDSHRVFWHAHLGNVFAIVLFPHTWAFEFVEGWWQQSQSQSQQMPPPLQPPQSPQRSLSGYVESALTPSTSPARDTVSKLSHTGPHLKKTGHRRTVFGSDWEDARHTKRVPVNTAGAYYSARLGVLEYLKQNKMQSGALVFREITPEYAMPVGVWQVREGVRAAMKKRPIVTYDIHDATARAASATGIKKNDWLAHAKTMSILRQTRLGDHTERQR